MIKKMIENCKYPLKYDYYITDDGRVWSEATKKFLSQQLDKYGYKKVALCSTDLKKGRHRYSVHRLVLENFNPVPNMDNLYVNHIDGDKTNNNLSNLEWTTPKENIKHAMEHGLRAKINGAAKLTPEEVVQICELTLEGKMLQKEIAEMFGVCVATIRNIQQKKAWKEITSKYNFN